jgi:hypothetical protein
MLNSFDTDIKFENDEGIYTSQITFLTGKLSKENIREDIQKIIQSAILDK